MRLIDADVLNEHKFLSPQYKQIGGRRNGKTLENINLAYQKGWNDAISAVIDNAPTIELEPNDCVLKKFGKCSYKETGCSDCKIKSNLRYICHSSSWKELQALREFKEKHEKKGKWVEHENQKWGGVWYTCSNCNQDALYEQDVYDIWRQKLSDFCPNCGADMRGDI